MECYGPDWVFRIHKNDSLLDIGSPDHGFPLRRRPIPQPVVSS
jgi:hypothetical protein